MPATGATVLANVQGVFSEIRIMAGGDWDTGLRRSGLPVPDPWRALDPMQQYLALLAVPILPFRVAAYMTRHRQLSAQAQFFRATLPHMGKFLLEVQAIREPLTYTYDATRDQV